MNKRMIFEQADDVVSQVDAQVETYIAANQDYPDRIESVNEMRERWLKVIRECEAYNILNCQENEVGKEPLQKSDLFKKFCVLFEKNGDVPEHGQFTWRLLVLPNTYLSPGQVVCFQEIMKIIQSRSNHYKNHQRVPVTRNSFNRIFVKMSTDRERDFPSIMIVTNDEISLHEFLCSGCEPICAPNNDFYQLKCFDFRVPVENIQPDAQFLFSNLFQLNISLSGQTASSNPFDVLNCMPKLESLNIKIVNWLTRIEKFPDLLELKMLWLSFDHVEVAADAFDHLTGLDYLCIDAFTETFETGLAPRFLECNIRNLKLNSLEVSKIESMDLTNNVQIESSLPLVGLKTLTTTNDSCSYQEFINIEVLHLCLANMGCLDHHRLKSLLNLKSLSIMFDAGDEENKIELEGDSLDDLVSLKALSIYGYGDVYTVSRDFFKHLLNIEYMSLGHFAFEMFEPGTFAHLSNLETLKLEDNQLTRWSPRVDEFACLKNLSLAENQLKSLAKRAFFGLSTLENLDLSINQIKTIENGAFDGLINLNFLNLSRNSFDSLDMSVLNKAGLLKLNDLGVHRFRLMCSSKNHNYLNEVVIIENDSGSIIEAIAKKGFLHLTQSNLTEMFC